ncbi:S-adenosyl-L-methionine-dependent methyltransferase [Apiospora arundinis]|uniref:S-adenosyl-L-methionine-dependent methyltransferase n=1 Tax=Apiospora arundinis TaxID=335852 RepID=A0ABR2ISS6_9PEZI
MLCSHWPLTVILFSPICTAYLARENPAASVIDTDLSMIQPTPEAVDVHNYEFIRDDAEEEWAFPSFTLDYVHMRAVALAFQSPRSVLGNAVKNLSPSCWVEYQDLDPTARSHDGTHKGKYIQLLIYLGIFDSH